MRETTKSPIEIGRLSGRNVLSLDCSRLLVAVEYVAMCSLRYLNEMHNLASLIAPESVELAKK